MRGKSLWIGIAGVVLVAAIAAAVTMQSAVVSRPQTVNEAAVLVVEPGVLPLAVSGVVPVLETLVYANVTNGWTGDATFTLTLSLDGTPTGCGTAAVWADLSGPPAPVDLCLGDLVTPGLVVASGATGGWVLFLSYGQGFSGLVDLDFVTDGTG
jgi:hypothetical protein